MVFKNEMIWPSPSQSSDASCYMIYWSGVVISTRLNMEAGINWPDEEIVNGTSTLAAMSTAREGDLVQKRLRDKGGDYVISPGNLDPTDYVKWEKGL